MSHEAHVAHHFDDAEQQYDACSLGMWIFLTTEILFFGALFTAYAMYRSEYPQAFAHASSHLSVWWGGFNTAVLLGSSLTMVLAHHAARTGHQENLVRNLWLTVLQGGGFLAVKAIEYSDKFAHHLYPGAGFEYHGADPGQAEIFFSLYFAMTGFHALHMVIGIAIVATLAVLAARGKFTPRSHLPVEMTGLYWHFVDIVWVFLYPLLYLIR